MVYIIFCMSLIWSTTLFADPSLKTLQEHLQRMDEGEKLTFEYTFLGCYGPYHHGRIVMLLRQDTIYYTETNYDHQGVEGISQSGQYARPRLLELLADAATISSTDVLGHAMSFRLSVNDQETERGAAKLDQAHFITIFQPFTTKFAPKKKSPIPGLKTGGFVN